MNDEAPAGEDGRRLVVIVNDRLTSLIDKGEITDRYYNPGSVFSEVHIVLTNDDRPPRDALVRLAGTERVAVHNVPVRRGMVVAAAVHRRLARPWLREMIGLVRALQPDLVRCYVPGINSVAARVAHDRLGIPYVVSVHGLPETAALGRHASLHGRLAAPVQQRLAAQGAARADAVVAVYKSLLPWLDTLPGPRAQVIYNVVCPGWAGPPVRDSAPADVLRVISTGRQIHGKLPDQLVRAVAAIPSARLLLVGDGPLHDELIGLAASLGASERVTFIRSLPNEELVQVLLEHDVFAVHNDYPGIPKTALEAMLAGLPVVINRPATGGHQELAGPGCVEVDNTDDAFRDVLSNLLDCDRRDALAAAATDRAWSTWPPGPSEARYAELHRRSASPPE